eukprot:687758_1
MAAPKRDDGKSWSKVKHGGFKRYSPGVKSRRKRKKKSNAQMVPILNGSSHGNISFKNLKQKMIKDMQFIEQTQLLNQFLLRFKSSASSNYRQLCETKGVDVNHRSSSITVNIICYALGSFSHSLSSMKQISFLLSVIKQLRTKCDGFECGKIELFEPLLTLTETNVLKTFGINVLLTDNMGRYAMNDTDDHCITLCFMPHSPRVLYNNLLATNWMNRDLLSKMYIVGNSFDQYYDLLIADKKDRNWIDLSKKLNILQELNLDEWIHADKTQHTDTLQRKRWSIMMNAFAFQKLMYFPVQRIANHSESDWIENANKQTAAK